MNSLELNTNSKLRLQLLLGICIVTGGISFCLSLVNIGLRSAYLLGSFELLFSAFSFYLALALRNTTIKNLMQTSYLISLSLLVLYAAYVSPIDRGTYLWALILPMIYYFLLGGKNAWQLCSGVFISQISILYLHTAQILSPPIVNFSLCYLLLWHMSHIYETARNRSEAVLAELALKDPLTQVNNRLALKKVFSDIVNPLETEQHSFFFFMIIDVDHFKQVNDMYGHEAGDEVLVEIAQRLHILVDNECFFRIGGEEFCVVHACQSLEQASELAEKLRKTINQKAFNAKHCAIHLSISIGVSRYQDGMLLNQVLSLADQALYQAKSQGRNCVVISAEENRASE